MPSDVTEAVAQDQIADSLMTAPLVDAEPAEQPGAEGEAETQEVETEPTEQAEETADDWLPTEQEKVFPLETLVKFGSQRYGYTQEQIQADPRLQNLIKDKLNTDIYLQQIQNQQQEVEEEPEQQQRQEPTPPQLNTQQWMEQVAKKADEITDPEVAQMFAGQFLQAFGVKEAPTPEMAKALARTMATFGLNLMNTVLPQMLNTDMGQGQTFFQQMMGKNYEGFDDTYQSSMYDRAWASVAKSNPAYAKLPGLTDEGSIVARQQAAAKIAGSVEDFDAMQFKGADGKPLSAYQTAVKKYSMLARTMAGEPLTNQQTKAVFDAGKKSARKAEVNRQAGNLGSGKSAGQIAGKSTDDDFWADGIAEYQKQHGRV
jgi:hypothetical protein